MLPFRCGRDTVDWDPKKDQENQKKHGVTFANAQFAFADPRRVIAEDEGGVLTVRFTYRDNVIRILSAGYWRKGKRIYESKNQVHERTHRKD